MNYIICIDENNGLSFNNRRLSRDQFMLKDMFNTYKFISGTNYSLDLFKEYNLENINNNEEHYFIEQTMDNFNINNCIKLIIYNWNRSYPSNVKIDIDLTLFNLIEEISFVGKSHKKITRITYIRK